MLRFRGMGLDGLVFLRFVANCLSRPSISLVGYFFVALCARQGIVIARPNNLAWVGICRWI